MTHSASSSTPSSVVKPASAVRIVLAVAMLALGLVVLAQAQPAAAIPSIQLDKSASSDVLVGDSISYTLRASNPISNPDAVAEYNTSFRDVLPLGVTYDGGSTSPASYGEPQVITNAGTGQQTLIWSNVADMAPGSVVELSFSATVSAAQNPAGAIVVNNAGVYANTNPRFAPRFTAAGLPIPLSYTQSATDTAQTLVTALRIEKTEPSPEGELLRGVHDHTTVYTLHVTNNAQAATNAVTVTDLIPAGMEFLGCGGVDNSSAPEYPGAPSLAATPVLPVATCPTPQSVSTVVNPAGNPAGTYTQVVWVLGDFATNGERTINYAAGIPQRANTATWPGATPAPTSLLQTANLNNNTGPSTREGPGEQSLTNRVRAEGDYQGAVVPGGNTHVIATDTETVTAEDVSMQKSVTPAGFAQGGVARYTFTINASEYVDATDIVIVDHLPNGLCPLDNEENYTTGPPAIGNGDCAPGAAFAPSGASFDNVVQNPDGAFDITFSEIDLDANGVAQVSFSARMRAAYTGGANIGRPTSANDEFTNEVELSGTTDPAPGVNPPSPTGPVTVHDDSSVTLTSGGPTIAKTILPNVTPMNCAVGTYTETPATAAVTFAEGDRVCFEVRVNFPSNVSTRNPVVTDFLPVGVTYEPNTAVELPDNNVPVAFDDDGDVPIWRLGVTELGGAFRFVQPGGVFHARFSAIVTEPADGPAPDITANLMKFRYSLTGGGTVSLRDAVDVVIAAPPPIGITKGVRDVNGVPAAGNPPNTDHVPVLDGDVVTFRVDLTNNGSAANNNAVPILGPDVWDALPIGITCADISAISDAGVCTDPGDGTHPTFAGNGVRSAVRWQLPNAPALAPGASRTLTYAMAIPSDASVSRTFTNTASVASYETATNRPGVTVDHHPADNVNTETPDTDWDVPAASNNSDVFLPDAAITKANVTDITEQNNGINQAVVGETLTYTVQLRVPAHTTVYNGRLTDPMPTGITYLSSTAGFSASNTSPATGPLPTGFTLDPANGNLAFPAMYNNDTNSPHLFEVQIRARVSTLASNTQGVGRVNTARFTSDTAEFGGEAVPPRTASSTVTVVAPAFTLTKGDDDADKVVSAGQQVTFTLRVTGTTGRPPTHDLWVIDCVPSGLLFGSILNPHPGTAAAVAGNGTNGCAAGTTRVAWNVPNSTTTQQTLSYTVTVSPAAVGGTTYTNTANARGSSLNDGKADPLDPDNPLERVVTSSASDTLTVSTGLITKTADPQQLTIGQRGTWTITVQVNPNVNFFDAAIIDTLPAAIDPNSVQVVNASCEFAGGGACSFEEFTPLTPSAGPSGSTRIGWGVGDIVAAPQARIGTIVYSAVLRDLPSVSRGNVVTNGVHASWNITDRGNPTSTADTFDLTSNEATANVTVIEPVLSIDKNVSTGAPAPGGAFSYTIDITNLAGPNTSAAFNTTFVDRIPVGVVVNAGSISNGGVLAGAGANGGGTITWTFAGPIPVGSTQTVTYEATLAASTTLTTAALTNTADITRYESLANGGRVYNGPEDTAVVRPVFPHVSVTKQASAGPAYIGESKAFTIRVVSDGASTAYNIGGNDVLPPNWVYDPGSGVVSVAGGPAIALDPDVVTADSVQTLTWPNLSDLAVGQQVVLTYSATPQPEVIDNPGVGPTANHTNTATVTAEDATGAPGNATASYAGPPATATVRIGSADLEIAKSHTGNPVAGQSFDWNVLVTNNGPDTATGAFTVVDDLPAGIGSTTASGPGWQCSVSTTQVTCTRTNAADTLASGQSFDAITITTAIPADTPSGTDFVNAASVDGHTYDPDPDNNDDTDTATSVRSVDLALTKQLNGAVVPGQNATYTLNVQNNGPSDSNAPIVVTDELPGGSTFVSATGAGWSCDEAGGTLTCTRADNLTNGQVAPAITVTVSIPADQQAAVVNTARVDGPDPDPVPGNNDDSVTTTPAASADLAIQKSSTNAFVPGDSGTYRFTVHNFGPSFADPVVQITDPLPAELTYTGFTSVTGSWTCSAAGQLVTCNLAGRLGDGADAVVDITVDIDPDHTGNTHNEATVSSPTPDPNEANNTDTDDTDNDVESDLAIDKSHTGPVIAGTNVTYTLAVQNNGPSTSSGPVVVSDNLPDELTFVSASGTDWNCGAVGQLVVCTRAAGIAADTSAPDITLVASVASDAGPTVINNGASVNGPDTDPNPDNNTDHDPTIILDQANLTLTKTTTGANPVAAGDETSFEVTVTNEGPSDAVSVSVVDTLPPGMSLLSASGPGWTCGDTAPVTCTRDRIVANTTAPVITVDVEVSSGVADGTTLTNNATVSTSTAGDDPDDNTDEADVDVVASADLQLDKSHPAGTVVAGTELTFDFDVTNAGPSDALAPIVIEDQLPVGMTYVSNNGPWSCSPSTPDASGQELECTLSGSDSLLAGADAPTLQITVQIAAEVDEGTLTNTATVDSPTDDPTPGNNTDTDDVEIQTEADLSIVKSHAGAAHVGDPLEFTLAVTNDGPSEARNVSVTDTLPVGLEFISATGTDWTCAAVDADVTCDLTGPLAPNTSAEPITLTVNVLPAAYRTVDNTADVTSTTPDPVVENNSSTDTVEVPPLVDLAITKTHQGSLKVGREVTYRLAVVNNGPTTDPGPVTVTDELPTGLSYVSATGDGWACSASGQTVTCEDADGMAVDERSVIRLVVAVGAAAYPSVTNVASVTSPAEDTNPDNNIAEDPADVAPRVDLTIDKELLSISPTTARWRVTVGNEGPNDTVSDVVVVDELPRELTYVSSNGRGWDCLPARQTVTCTHPGVIRVDDSSSFTLTTEVNAPAGTELVNVATVTAGDTDGSQPSDDAAGTVPDSGTVSPGGEDNGPGGGLPGTGGVWLGLLVIGLLLTLAGVFAVRHGRRG